MQTIGIFYSKEKKKSSELAKNITGWLNKKAKKVCEITEDISSNKFSDLDLIISIGGDGSLLKLASIIKERSIPVVGVNAGRLGFLTNIKENEVFQELELIFSGKYITEERLMLSACVKENSSREEECFSVLNDVVISREGVTRFLTITVSVDNNTVTQFGGDGVIVATPTGSTAYSLSSGGAFLFPSLEGIIITPVCPHSLQTRPVVVPSDTHIEIRLECEKKSDHAFVIFDGQEKRKVFSNSVVNIVKAPHSFHFITSSQRSYFDIVREKF